MAARGFTLLEVMVVVLVAGIVAGVAVLSLRAAGAEARAAEAGRQVLAALAFARDEAELLGETRGLRVEAARYRLLAAADGGWTALPGRLGVPAPLPGGWRLRLEAEGRAMARRAPDDAPQVLFLGSGEATPFRLSVLLDDGREAFRIDGDGFGRLRGEAVAP